MLISRHCEPRRSQLYAGCTYYGGVAIQFFLVALDCFAVARNDDKN
jgi:hypothetical protein